MQERVSLVALAALVVARYFNLTGPFPGQLVLVIVLVLGFGVMLPTSDGVGPSDQPHRATILTSPVFPVFLSLMGVLACIVYAKYQFSDFLKVGYDDSFITFRYAKNLADFGGLRFNPGDNSNSASSLTFTVLLAFLDRLTPLSSLWNANVLNLVGMYSLLYWPIRAIFVRTRPMRALLISLPLAGIVGVYPPLVYWTFSGMETTFFLGLMMAAVTWTADQTAAQETDVPRSDWKLALVLSILTLTRVEGALAAGALGALLAFDYWRKTGRRSVFSAKTIGLLLVSPLTFMSQLVFYWLYYSSPVSDPIHFKDLVMYYQRTISEAADSLEAFLFRVNGPLLFLLGLASVWLVRVRLTERRRFRGVLPSALTFVVLYIFGLRSPYSDEQRYELMLIVPLIALLKNVVVEVVNRLDLRTIVGKTTASLVIFGLCLTGFQNLSLGAQIHSRTQTYLYVQQARIDAGNWLEANTSRGTRVVSSDIGALSFFNNSNVYLDAAGLVNRTQLSAVRNGRDIYKAMKDQRPEFLVDTVDASGMSGVEQILSDPLSYYIAGSGARTTCGSRPIFVKEVLKTFPEFAMAGLQVRISRIIGFTC